MDCVVTVCFIKTKTKTKTPNFPTTATPLCVSYSDELEWPGLRLLTPLLCSAEGRWLSVDDEETLP